MSIPHSLTPPLKGSPTPPIHSFTPPLRQSSDHFYPVEDLEDLPYDIFHPQNRLLLQLVLLHMHCESGSEEDLMIQHMICIGLDPEACPDKKFLVTLSRIQELASKETWNPEIRNLSGRAIHGMTHPSTAPEIRRGHC